MDVLVDISNKSADRIVRKRLSDGTIKEYHCKRNVLKNLQLTFQSETEKLCFEEKMKKSTELCFKTASKTSNAEFLDILLDNYLQLQASTESSNPSQLCCEGGNSNIHVPEAEEEMGKTMFVTETKQVIQLVDFIQEHSKLCPHQLQFDKEQRDGHAGILTFKCCIGHRYTFQSSSKEGSYYTANLRLMLGIVCSGLLPVQFGKICDFGNLGKILEEKKTVMMSTLTPVISQLAKESITDAITEEKMKSADNDNGISIMNDARHNCRKKLLSH